MVFDGWKIWQLNRELSFQFLLEGQICRELIPRVGELESRACG